MLTLPLSDGMIANYQSYGYNILDFKMEFGSITVFYSSYTVNTDNFLDGL